MRACRYFAGLMVALMCLGTTSIAGATAIEKILMPGEVSKAHAKYETECVKCHDRSHRERQTALCLDCHKDIATDLKSKRGFHGNAVKTGTECTACHNEHKGRGADSVRFDRESFEHAVSGYKLEGRHQTVACSNCHVTTRSASKRPISITRRPISRSRTRTPEPVARIAIATPLIRTPRKSAWLVTPETMSTRVAEDPNVGPATIRTNGKRRLTITPNSRIFR